MIVWKFVIAVVETDSESKVGFASVPRFWSSVVIKKGFVDVMLLLWLCQPMLCIVLYASVPCCGFGCQKYMPQTCQTSVQTSLIFFMGKYIHFWCPCETPRNFVLSYNRLEIHKVCLEISVQILLVINGCCLLSFTVELYELATRDLPYHGMLHNVMAILVDEFNELHDRRKYHYIMEY